MKTILICPSERPAVSLLAESVPLASVPFLGQSLLEYWMAYVASAGVKQVFILASDRVEQVQQLLGDGARWGVTVEALQEFRELTPAQALMKVEKPLNSPAAQEGVAVLDHFPGLPQFPLFTSYADFFKAVSTWMPLAQTADRVGLRQLQPGVWVGLRSRVSASAQLTAPCWVGNNVWIGPRAVLGPGTILEDGVFIEANAELSYSHVSPNTFVGKFARLTHSLAWGDNLINWKTNSTTKVPDPFLLCSLSSPKGSRSAGLFSRLAGLWSARRRPQSDALEALLNEQTRPI